MSSDILTQFAHLSNEELRQELNKNGIVYGPIMASTRKVYEKKLQNFLEGKNDTIMNGNGVTATINNGNSASANGNSNGTGDIHTPSREVSREKSPQEFGNEQSQNCGQREKSPIVENDSDKEDELEDDTEEATRILTPEEIRSFRHGMRRNTESPNSNGRLIQSEVKDGGNLPTIDGSKSILQRFGIPLLVIFTVIGLFFGAIQMREHLPLINWEYLTTPENSATGNNEDL